MPPVLLLLLLLLLTKLLLGVLGSLLCKRGSGAKKGFFTFRFSVKGNCGEVCAVCKMVGFVLEVAVNETTSVELEGGDAAAAAVACVSAKIGSESLDRTVGLEFLLLVCVGGGDC